MNNVKTVVLLTALTVLLVLVGGALGGETGMMFALVLAFVMNMGSYWFSDKIALAMSGAHAVSEEEAPELHRIVEEVASQAGVPKPRVHIIESDSPNAFATGRDPGHAAVAVTTGIMSLLTRRELVGVLGHELGHVRNRDILISSVVATVAGAITMLAHMAQWAMLFGGFGRSDDDERGGVADLAFGLLMIIVAPIAAALIQLAVSRAREYQADTTGAEIVHDPLALASALEKLERGVQVVPAKANPATAHLYIVSPLTGGAIAGLFSTHPPVAQRVARLRHMAGVAL
ncbi:MAG: zinc metalloprotease HtpX [Chloroflexi bacterium]|nr:zinc metalloprotease HtpX [Chloroflexota bacterium]